MRHVYPYSLHDRKNKKSRPFGGVKNDKLIGITTTYVDRHKN